MQCFVPGHMTSPKAMCLDKRICKIKIGSSQDMYVFSLTWRASTTVHKLGNPLVFTVSHEQVIWSWTRIYRFYFFLKTQLISTGKLSFFIITFPAWWALDMILLLKLVCNELVTANMQFFFSHKKTKTNQSWSFLTVADTLIISREYDKRKGAVPPINAWWTFWVTLQGKARNCTSCCPQKSYLQQVTPLVPQ